ncbi:MAG: ABC transporter substrate-binding protein [Pseudomonadota bacterium]
MNILAATIAAVISLSTLTLSTAHAQAKPQEVRVAMLPPSALQWLHAIAEKQGFYGKHGVLVRELRASDSPALLQAVSSGSADAGISLGDLAVRAIDKGAPIVITGAVLQKTILRLYGDKSVQGAKDLAGKKVTAGAVRGGTANLLKYQLQQVGVDPASVQMVSIPNSRDRIVALENGQVTGALLIPPFDTLAERKGAKMFHVYREPYVQTPLIVNKTWAAANRGAATGVTQALRDAAQWVNQPANKDAAIDILAGYTGVARDICVESYAFIIQDQKAISTDLSFASAGLENLFKIDAAVGGEGGAQSFQLSRYFDASFLNAKP